MALFKDGDFFGFDEANGILKLRKGDSGTPATDEVRIIYEDSVNKLKVYSGSAWVEIGELAGIGLTDIVRTAVETNVSVDIVFEDGYKMCAGTGKDLTIYHDNANAFIENITGNLSINNLANSGTVSITGKNAGGTTKLLLGLDPVARTAEVPNVIGSVSVTIADDGKHSPGIEAGAAGTLTINLTGSAYAQAATFDMGFAATHSLVLNKGDAATWSHTATTAGKINVYLDGSNNVEVENKTGGSVTVEIWFKGNKLT